MTIIVQPLHLDRPRNTPDVPKSLTRCLNCGLWDVCLPCDLVQPESVPTHEPVVARRRVKAGNLLFRAGDEFHSLYTIRSGFFKTTQCVEDGRDQVTGFYMAGELLGMDGISTGMHAADSTALENSEVCVIQYSMMENLNGAMHRLQRQFHRAMGREMARMQGVALLLGTMTAEERLAAFLLDLSQRFAARGYSPMNFVLRMTRQEIGSYLGVKFETVSRMFSKLVEDGVIKVRQKEIHILDLSALSHCVGHDFGRPDD